MTKLERVQRYIDRTKIPTIQMTRYGLIYSEFNAIYAQDTYTAILTAFNYGMAKGWRMAKREAGR